MATARGGAMHRMLLAHRLCRYLLFTYGSTGVEQLLFQVKWGIRDVSSDVYHAGYESFL